MSMSNTFMKMELKKPETFNIYVIYKNQAHMLTNLLWSELDRVADFLDKANRSVELSIPLGIGQEILYIPKWATKRLAQKLRKTKKLGWKRIDDTHVGIRYSNTDWITKDANYSSNYHNGTAHYSLDNSSSIEFSFTGSKLRLIQRAYTNQATAKIEIDGKEYEYTTKDLAGGNGIPNIDGVYNDEVKGVSNEVAIEVVEENGPIIDSKLNVTVEGTTAHFTQTIFCF